MLLFAPKLRQVFRSAELVASPEGIEFDGAAADRFDRPLVAAQLRLWWVVVRALVAAHRETQGEFLLVVAESLQQEHREKVVKFHLLTGLGVAFVMAVGKSVGMGEFVKVVEVFENQVAASQVVSVAFVMVVEGVENPVVAVFENLAVDRQVEKGQEV